MQVLKACLSLNNPRRQTRWAPQQQLHRQFCSHQFVADSLKSAKISVARTTSSNTDKKLGIANRSKVDIPTPADMSARDPRHHQSETNLQHLRFS
jgi:hypothetical protein